MLDYRIDTFLTLCDCLNYHKTAELLHITQPAVTQHIHTLEKQYGCILFKYENHVLKKTNKAYLLEEYVRAAKAQAYQLQEKLDHPGKTFLRVGATKTIGDYFLPGRVEEYLQDEGHELNFIVDNTEHLLHMIDHNEIDFAIVEGFFDRDKYDSLLVKKEPFVGICSINHPFADKEINIKELLNETIIHREDGSGTRAILEQTLNAHNESISRFRRCIGISSFALILDLVKKGYGISFVYEILAKSDTGIAKFTLRGEPIVREFNVVSQKHALDREKIAMFLHM